MPEGDSRLLPREEAGPSRSRMTRGFASPTLRAVPITAPDPANFGEELDFPWYIPKGAFLGAIVFAGVALYQRDGLWPPDENMLFALVALTPWLVEHGLGWFVPRYLMAGLVIAGVGALAVNQTTNDFVPFLLVIMVAEVASTASLRTAVVVTLGTTLMLGGFELLADYDGALIWIAAVVAGLGFGVGVQSQIRVASEERAKRELAVEKAAGDERQRIAREIHDVIAHSLSVTLLHLTGARRALETDGDTDEAVGALRDAERLGRQAMNDIRRTVGLLQPDGHGERVPMPGLADVRALCGEFARAGVDVECEIAGDPDGVSLATGLGLYRIAQESLANAARHAPGAPVTVMVDVAADPVTMAVHNGRANGQVPAETPDVGGLGLKGIEERVRLLGGTCRFGPEADGWSVRVSVPREAEVA